MSAAFIRRLRTPGSSDRSSVGPALGEHDIILGVSNMGCTGRQTLPVFTEADVETYLSRDGPEGGCNLCNRRRQAGRLHWCA